MAEIESPCTKICQLDPGRDYCVGCGRTLGEIGRWPTATEAEREAILERLPGRLAGLGSAGLGPVESAMAVRLKR